MTLEDMRASDRYADLFILARYFYRIGEPIMDDYEYEELLLNVRKRCSQQISDYLDRTYDDDPIPLKLLNEIGVEPISIKHDDSRERLFQYLNSEKSLSIDSVTSYGEAYTFFSKYREEKKDLMVSLKMDGDNVKTLYLDGNLELSLSRGRNAGISFDFTDTVKRVFPNSIMSVPHELRIYAEAYVEEDYLETLRRKYNPNGYKTCKSAAISLLRVQHSKEDYEHLRIIVHGIDGLGSSVSEDFQEAEQKGFSVVEHKLVPWEDIPVDKTQFREWLKREVFDYFEQKTDGVPSDGIVVEVNDKTYTGITAGQYSSRQLALKFEQWSFKVYKGIIEDIIWEQKRVLASCRIRIKPMRTDDGCSANWINAFNFSIVVNEGLDKGSEVYYVRNSGAVNVLVYGAELDRLLGR